MCSQCMYACQVCARANHQHAPSVDVPSPRVFHVLYDAQRCMMRIRLGHVLWLQVSKITLGMTKQYRMRNRRIWTEDEVRICEEHAAHADQGGQAARKEIEDLRNRQEARTVDLTRLRTAGKRIEWLQDLQSSLQAAMVWNSTIHVDANVGAAKATCDCSLVRPRVS